MARSWAQIAREAGKGQGAQCSDRAEISPAAQCLGRVEIGTWPCRPKGVRPEPLKGARSEMRDPDLGRLKGGLEPQSHKNTKFKSSLRGDWEQAP